MKNILVVIFLIVGFNSVAQPPGYIKRNIRENVISFVIDSTLHIPRYNGTPSGVRSGGYVADGAIGMDTTNHRFYIYSNGGWIRMANFSELSSYVAVADSAAMLANYLRGATAGFGMSITGSQHKTWTVDSTSGGVISYRRLKKVLDSLSAIGAFAVPSLNQVLNAGNTASSMHIDINDGQYINFDADVSGFNARITGVSNGGDGYIGITNDNGANYAVLKINPTAERVYTFPDASLVLAGADFVNSWGDGIKQTFNPNGTNAGVNVGSHTAAPSSLANGDIWYNSTSNELNARINGATVALGAGGGSGTNNVNVGAGYRLYQPSTEGIKTLFNGYAVGIDSSSNTDGITLKADSALLTTKLLTYKVVDSLNALGWGNTYSVNSELNYQQYFDIAGASTASADVLYTAASGAGAAVTRPGTGFDNWFGMVQFATGTTTTGFTYGHFGNSGVIMDINLNTSYRYNVGTKIRLEDLSDGTDTYHVMFGFSDANNNDASTVDGAWFSYTHSASSGQFVCNTRSNSVSTTTASGITVAADTDYELEISVFGGSAYFYINKSLVATIATNVPSGTARATSIGFAIRKSAGTTSRNMYFEWFGYGKKRS